MKTLKFAKIAALIACTMVSLANEDGFKSKPKLIKVVNLTLETAVQNQGLEAAIYALLEKDDFLNNIIQQDMIVAEVTYQGSLYRISGTREQWLRFFNLQGELPINANQKRGALFYFNTLWAVVSRL